MPPKQSPIFEPLFAAYSLGYRPGRSPHMAMRKVWREINEGNLWILDADLRSYFDKIDQERLVDLIAAENQRRTSSATDPQFSRSWSDYRRCVGADQDRRSARRSCQSAVVEHLSHTV